MTERLALIVGIDSRHLKGIGMATDAQIIKSTCTIYVCKQIKTTGITEINNAIDWIQANNTAQERADLIAAYVSRDAYLIGVWWKNKFEEYMDVTHRPVCEAFWVDDSLSPQEVEDIFKNADTLGCF